MSQFLAKNDIRSLKYVSIKTHTLRTMTKEKYTISTRTYILKTNLKIASDKLESVFENLDPISYEMQVDGVIKVSVRGKSKGMCKKERFKRVKKTKPEDEPSCLKSFRNQVSFYVRFLDNIEIPLLNRKVEYDEKGFFAKKIKEGRNRPEYAYIYKRGQTAFQFKKINVSLVGEFQEGHDIHLFTSVIKKSQEGQLKNITHKITKEEIDNKVVSFLFPEGSYAQALYIDTGGIEVAANMEVVMEVNMFLFTSGQIKVAGVIKDSHVDKSMAVLVNHIKSQLTEEQTYDIFGCGSNDLTVHEVNPTMINSDFTGEYAINRYKLDNLVREKYKIISSWESGSHPATKIKYFINDAYEGCGRCCCPSRYGNRIYCNGRGNGCGSGQCKTVTILVFRKGKVILTGGRTTSQVDSAFEFITDVFKKEKHIISQVEQVEDDDEDESVECD